MEVLDGRWDLNPLGFIPLIIENLPIIHEIPMVHTRVREPVVQLARRWLGSQEVLGSNPPGIHSKVWLPKSC